jgi:hypothetical protein
MGLTSFFLVYGAEAILPSDVQCDSPRVEATRKKMQRSPGNYLWTCLKKKET